LGDFCKGLDQASLDAKVRAGLLNHRAIDRYTDHHPLIREAKLVFSKPRRRFAGIVLDVLFDHYLIRHWASFSDREFTEFKQNTYELLSNSHGLMPAKMALTMESVVAKDWFSGYQTLEGVGFALDRIAGRIRFENQFANSIEEITRHDMALEQVFLAFFPQLQQHVIEQNLEANHS